MMTPETNMSDTPKSDFSERELRFSEGIHKAYLEFYTNGGMAPVWETIRLLRIHVAEEVADQAVQLHRDNAKLREDKARLDWLIEQGPPGASEANWLTEETWELATMFAGENGDGTDAKAIRDAIDAARKADPRP